MRFAIGAPNVREYADPRMLVALARAAEESGWDGFFVWDHLVYRGRGDPVVDPWAVIAAAAAQTSTIRLGVLVAALARRRPWVVARTTVSIDLLSNGRLVFGAGLGSLDEEFAGFGEEPDARGRAEILDEALEIVTGLWSGAPFQYRGAHFHIGETVFTPTPLQLPRIPVWIGGRWPNKRPFLRAARWDGVFPTHRDVGPRDNMPPGELKRIVDYTLAHREAGGPLDVVMEGCSDGSDGPEVTAPYEDAGLTWWIERLGWLRGSPDEMRRRVREGPPRP